MENRIHTPEGVRDIYGEECRRKRIVLGQLQQVMRRYHYEEIKTPTFEYFDVFNGEKGTAASREMYKFFDRENNTLVLRPDITPSVARCVCKYFAEEQQHIRLWYQGQTFQNLSRLQGKLNEFTQLGAELIGDDTSAADGEIVSMIIDCFLAVGLREFQVSIGQVDYFRGLVEEAGLATETAHELRLAIQNKNTFAIEKICREARLSGSLSDAFIGLTRNYGGVEMLKEAAGTVRNARCAAAIERLEKLYRIIAYYGYESYVSFDLGMLSHYNYYTGVIYKGYTYGSGSPVVSGGRYNGLLRQFGVDKPSVGFAFLVDELMLALLHQKVQIDTHEEGIMVLYMPALQKEAIQLAKLYRSQKKSVQLTRKSSRCTLEEYLTDCQKHGIDRLVFWEKDTNRADVYCVADASCHTATVEELKGGAL